MPAMRKLDLYIVKTVTGATVLVLLVFLSLDFVFSFIGELGHLRNNYQVPQALMFLVYTLPRRTYDYLPLAAFMGCLIGLGTLAGTSELTVMRAAGVSLRRIIWAAIKPTLIIVLMGLLLGQYVAPYFERIAESNQAMEQRGTENLVAGHGVWQREGQTFLYFNAVLPNGVLEGISMFTFNDRHWLESASYARRAIYQGDHHWELENIVTTHITPHGTRLQHESSRRWQTGLTPDLLKILMIDPDRLSLSGLYHYARYLNSQNLNADGYWLAFWNKALRPLATIALVLVAISFVFGPLRSVTMGFRVFTGIIVGLLFKYLQDLLGPTTLVFGLSPILAILVPIGICVVVGALLIKRSG